MNNSEPYKTRDNKLAVVQKANEIRRKNLLKDALDSDERDQSTLAQVDILLRSKGIDVDKCKPQSENSIISYEQNTLNRSAENGRQEHQSEDSSWNSIVNDSRNLLLKEGVDPDSLSTYSFLSSKKLAEIDEYLNRPIYSRIPWDKLDYSVSMLAGVVGGLLDLVLCTPGEYLHKKIADKNSWIGEKFEKIHSKHEHLTINGEKTRYFAPTDHQKSGVSGGGYHRGLSSGHDLFYAIDGIRQFKNGEFHAIDWKDNVATQYVSNLVKPDGTNKYISLSLGKAIIAYSIHMFCDFFSSTSLPLPGTNFFHNVADHDVRKLTQQVYTEGLHLRNLTFQTLPPILISIFIRVYFWFRNRKIDCPEDAKIQKRTEMTTLALAISSAMNLGKVYIKSAGQPLSLAYYLNYPQLIIFAKNLLHLLILESKRNDYTAKIRRNLNELSKENDKISLLIKEKMLSTYEIGDKSITELQ